MIANAEVTLRIVRKFRGLTQWQLADRVGLSQTTISLYEQGMRNPDDTTTASLAAVLSFPPAYLMLKWSDIYFEFLLSF